MTTSAPTPSARSGSAPVAARPDRPAGPARALSDLAATASSEWVKLRSVRSTWWGAALTLGLSVTVAPLTAVATVGNMQQDRIPSADVPASEMAVYAAVWAAQFAVIALALPVMTSEYSSRSVHPALQAVPARVRLLAAKAAALMSFVFACGLVTGAAATLTAHLVMLHPLIEGYGTLDPAEAVADVVRLSAYLALVAALTLGAGTALRSAAAALAAVSALLFALPAVLVLLGGRAGVYVAERLPLSAGVSFVDSVFVMGRSEAALPPAAGGMVLLCWSASALVAGALVLTRRDA
ncbi:ABC transporter permease [Nocardiopsis sp. NPDC101807]|uniref:ABC transporter permease n=1 Tax=Nocardiopsis sp. NPDC101807 TaxID=3364339 RepID=UPI00381756F9